jgi:SAM-dependent methyltransferase
MTERGSVHAPSAFIARCSAELAALFDRGARVLDVAAGHGRHSVALAARGFRVTAIDMRLDALRDLQAAAREIPGDVATVCADLTMFPLPQARFELIVVARYLDRERLPLLIDALAPGGVLVYETFTERQLQYARGPRSRAHLLAPGELRTLVHGLHVLFDQEVTEPEALARIVARRNH